MSIQKKIFTLFFIFLFIIYSLEILFYQFVPNEQKMLINIKSKRVDVAKKKKLEYDLRSSIEAYFSESKNNKDLFTPFYFNKNHFNLKTVKNNLIENNLIPFRGPINRQTLSCAEDLAYKLINNDKFGFKNPNDVYENEIEIVLLGDSYAEGLCENEKNDIAGHLRNEKFNTLNLGVTGSGPLLSLATLKEYGSKFSPKNVVYLYFEGNDLIDLEWEKKTYLINYLEPEFKLDYLNSSKKIIKFLNDVHEEKILIMKAAYSNENKIMKIEKNLFATTKDILELTSLKSILRSNSFFYNKNLEMDLFYKTLIEMKLETEKFGGNFIFIYVPSWSRYFTKYNKDKILFDKKEEIFFFLKKQNIKYFDFENEISNSLNKEKYFPLDYIGHFNSFGYKKLSNSILKLIN